LYALRGEMRSARQLALEAIHVEQEILKETVGCQDQVLAAHDIAGMKQVRRECAIPVMADESLVTADQARRLVEANACDLFNIRLSKNGGIAGSLAIARLAQEAGIKIQVGAQVGETGILSAAGRTFAAHMPALVCAEGSFGTWLLTEDITFDNLAFGPGGRAPLLKGRGLSVTVKDEAMERLTVEKIELHR
jgi:muconate cycloisomerase